MSENINATIESLTTGFEDFKASHKETLASLEEHLKAAATGAKEDAKSALDSANAAAERVVVLADRLTEAEQKLVDGVMSGKAATESLGALVTKSDAYQRFASGGSNKMRIEANTIIGQEGSPLENADTIVPSQRLPGIIPGAFRQLRVRDVLPQGTTSSNLIEYTRELAFTNNAAETAEGTAKPETDVTFELVSAPVRTIAHWLKLSKQVMDDAPALASYIDTRLRYGVELRIDQSLLNGNGTGQNISGMTNTSNFTAFTPTSGDTSLDSINRAIYAVIAADYAPTAIIMNPADWGAIERVKGSDDHYVVGNPQGRLGPVLWGLPVVVTNNMTSGKFMVGSMDIAYQVWNRQGTAVEMFDTDEDNVQKNLVTVRAESRLALAVYRPASVQYGDLIL